MRFYNQQHRFYCGVDLHARTLAVCVLDAAGTAVFRDNVTASPVAVRGALAPFREGLVVAWDRRDSLRKLLPALALGQKQHQRSFAAAIECPWPQAGIHR